MKALPASPNLEANRDRYGGGDECCIVCGKPAPTTQAVVHVWWGSHLVTETEAATLDPSGDTGFYPIGADCARRYLSAEDSQAYVQHR